MIVGCTKKASIKNTSYDEIMRKINTKINANGDRAYLPHPLFQSNIFAVSDSWQPESEATESRKWTFRHINRWGDTVTVKSCTPLTPAGHMGIFLSVTRWRAKMLNRLGTPFCRKCWCTSPTGRSTYPGWTTTPPKTAPKWTAKPKKSSLPYWPASFNPHINDKKERLRAVPFFDTNPITRPRFAELP